MRSEEERPFGEVAFHLLLAGFLLPMVTAPAAWLAFGVSRSRGETIWPRRLFLVALLDTLAVIALASTMAFHLDAPASPGRARIGVVLDDDRSVREVVSGSPAERAGIHAGDVIVRADGEEMRDVATLRERIGRGGSMHLTVRRGDRDEDIVIHPTTTIRTDGCREGPSLDRAPSLARLAPYGVFLVLVVGLWIVGRRRGAAQWLVWIPLVAVLIGSSALATGAHALTCAFLGGGHAELITLVASELAMVVLAFVFFRIARARIEADRFVGEPALPTLRGYGYGVFYLVSFTARILFLSIPLLWATHALGAGGTSGMLEEVVTAGADDRVSAALVGSLAVVLAPIAEELLFRGIVLPHLARTLSPWAAITFSAILFGMLHVDHGVLLIGPLTIGVVLGWARWRTGSIGVPILLHTTVNGAALLLSWARG